jgi:hypothetical protein
MAPAPRDRTEPSKSSQQSGHKKQIVISKDKFGISVVPYNVDGKIAGNGLLHFSYGADQHHAAMKMANYLNSKYHWPIVDLTKEASMKTEKQKFQSLVRECIAEVKSENDPRIRLKESLRKVVRNVLKEISTGTKPEPDKDEKEKVQKGFAKAGNERLDKNNTKLCKELETIVHGINADWDVYWDDRSDLVVSANNLLSVRITPKSENNFDIDAMVKLADRIRVIAVTWEQVKSFVKANFGTLENKTDVAKKKSIDHYEDRDVIKKAAGPIQTDIKNRGEKKNGEDAKIKDTKRDDKNYNEPQTKRDEDMPDQPMKQVTEPGKDPDSKNKNIEKTPHVKPQKHKNEDGADKLKTNLPATKKFRLRK